MTSPDPGQHNNSLAAVATIPGGGAWAVGLYFNGLESLSLALR